MELKTIQVTAFLDKKPIVVENKNQAMSYLQDLHHPIDTQISVMIYADQNLHSFTSYHFEKCSFFPVTETMLVNHINRLSKDQSFYTDFYMDKEQLDSFFDSIFC
jgi:hypothetical protein